MDRYALLIGSSNYNDSQLQNLRCPVNDVTDLESVLRAQEYGAFNEVFALKDPSVNEARRKMSHILRSARRDDLVLIYYSGHGKLDIEGSLFLSTVDTDVNDLEVTSISVDEIKGLIRKGASRKIVLIFDCCYSGQASEAFMKGDVDEQLQRVQRDGNGIYLLTASSGQQVAQEKAEDQNSLLTKHILKGIQDGAADTDDKGHVSIGDLFRYASRQMKNEGFQSPRKWDFEVEGDDLVIANTGKTSGQKRREEIRGILYKALHEDVLPFDVVEKADKILRHEKDKLPEDLLGYNDLLDRLIQKNLKISEFNVEWNTLERKMSEDLRRKKTQDLYRQAKSAIKDDEWVRAEGCLQDLLQLDPTYADAPDLLEQIQHRLKEMQLYEEGREHHKNGRWADAISALTQIRSADINPDEVKQLIKSAEEALAKEREQALAKEREQALAKEQEEAKRRNDLAVQNKLAELYAKASDLLKVGNHQDALAYLEQIETLQSPYRDVKHLLQTVKETIHSAAELKGDINRQYKIEKHDQDILDLPSTPSVEKKERPRDKLKRRQDLVRQDRLVNRSAAHGLAAVDQQLRVLQHDRTNATRTKVNSSWGCASVVFFAGTILVSCAIFLPFWLTFQSPTVKYLFLLGMVLVGLFGVFVIVVGFFVTSGTAKCPVCGAQLENLEARSNEGVFCKQCNNYLDGTDGWLSKTEENRIADTAIFGGEVTTTKPKFPSGCCVCGNPATRQDVIKISGAMNSEATNKTLGKLIEISVPYCANHSDGVVFEEKGLKPHIKFRSHAYWRHFNRLNRSSTPVNG